MSWAGRSLGSDGYNARLFPLALRQSWAGGQEEELRLLRHDP